jgi:LacI family transcriptional regulator
VIQTKYGGDTQLKKAISFRLRKIDEDLIIKIEDIDNCAIKIENLIKSQNCDAIFAVNELFAVTAIKKAAQNNLKVPDDISVIGFTDGIISQFSTPSISTVSQNGIKMGRKSAQMLIDRLELEDEENEQYTTEIIETNLIIRESTTTK